ncbi:MFS general substrate transporter [Amanita rubescens]|nr:MFS general substrate transporter [Amanita rubescens]
MALFSPRASRLFSEPPMTRSYDQDIEQPIAGLPDLPNDCRTPLDKTIDRIGMGSYQWTLLSLCGFGWMADNMWIQAVAIILPRVQQQFSVPDSYIGVLSSSMFAGMMFGAIGWGTCSDLLGRSTAFNLTLFFTALFGLTSSLAYSFVTLCISLFFLGSAVGGSMPTDGTLLLEHMPKEKQYLVTALSVFFSFGAILSAIVALLVIPQNSCPVSSLPCNVDVQNKGWKYLLIALGLITLLMFLARIVFFRLYESPRYLVHAGRPQEAVKALQMISRFNGSDLSIELDDVVDHRHPSQGSDCGQAESTAAIANATKTEDDIHQSSGIPIIQTATEVDETSPFGTPPNESTVQAASSLVADYNAIGETVTPLDQTDGLKENSNDVEEENEDTPLNPGTTIKPPRDQSNFSTSSHASFTSRLTGRKGGKVRLRAAFPRWLADPLDAWIDRVMMVLSPEWSRTTLLVWSAWFGMSLAFTMFNVFLPKLLEYAPGPAVVGPKSLEDSLWDVVVFTIGGCPGAILGAFFIESSLGRRWSLAGSTFATAVMCAIFTMVESPWAVRLTTICISLSATAMWAVLYGWTPEIFGTRVRGTACGIASALSRIGGMIAPLLGGMLLVIDRSIPVYTSVVTFAIAGCCVLLLKEDNSPRKRGGMRSIAH